MAQPNPFPLGSNTAAPEPSGLWDVSFSTPFPTNAPWQNFVLNNGTSPEMVHPYLVRTAGASGGGGGGVAISYPGRAAPQGSGFLTDITIASSESLGPHRVVAYDDLSVTLQWGQSLTVPLVRGSPYVTFICEGVTPTVSSAHATVDLSSNEDCTKHKLQLENGHTWLLYSSAPLSLGPDLQAHSPFSGVVRIALLPSSEDEELLDRHSSCYPIGGSADLGTPYQVSYRWETGSWREGDNTLVMLSLPMHRQILEEPSESTGKLGYHTPDGPMEGVCGSKWVLTEPSQLAIGWEALRGALRPGADSSYELAAAVRSDIVTLQPIQSASPYCAGKLLARAARLVLIAEELGLETDRESAVEVLRTGLTAWLDGTLPKNGLIYDTKWGGIVSEEGSQDPTADSGNGLYNDHHYQWGYFLYAGAVLAKMDVTWAAMYKRHLYTLMYDIVNPGVSLQFPRLRHFDPWVLHSWATGLSESPEGRIQDTTNKAVNAFYSVSLLGLAYDDTSLTSFGCTLTALETRAVRTLRSTPSGSNLEVEFGKDQRAGGWSAWSRQDTGVWFAALDGPGGSSTTPTKAVTTAGALLLARAAAESLDHGPREPEREPESGSASQLSITFNEARRGRTRGDLKHLPSMEAAIKQGVAGRSYSGQVVYDRSGRRVVGPRPARVASANWLGPEKQAPPTWKKFLCLAA